MFEAIRGFFEGMRVQRETRMLEAKIRLESLKQSSQLIESLAYNNNDFIDSDLVFRARYVDPDGTVWTPVANKNDRKAGRNHPMIRTDVDLGRVVQKSRILCEVNAFADCLLVNSMNTTIGKGFTYTIKPRPHLKGDVSQHVNDTQAFVDWFLEDNRWNEGIPNDEDASTVDGTGEQESYRRWKRDGGTFVRIFGQPDGRAIARFVEPEQIYNPPAGTEADGWSFGIRHQMEPHEDVQKILEYCIHYHDATGKSYDWEIVPAREIVHMKGHRTDRTVKRGVPAFRGDGAAALERAAKLQNNISTGAAIRAAIAETWQHRTGTRAQVDATMSTHNRPSPVIDQVTGKPVPIQHPRPGTVRHLSKGMELVPNQTDATVDSHLNGVQGDLRQAGAPHCAPEYWTGDASNGNYSSLETATSPTTKNGETEQEYCKSAFGLVVWKAVQHAVRVGKLPSDTCKLLMLVVEAPAVLHRNELEVAQANQIMILTGYKSRQTAAAEAGLDWGSEGQNISEYNDEFASAPMGLPTGDVLGMQYTINRQSGVQESLSVPDVRQERNYDCGAAALMSALQALGVGVQSLAELRQVLGTNPRDGTSRQAIIRYARSVGLRVSDIEDMQIADLVHFTTRSVVLTPIQAHGGGHWVVVEKVSRAGVTMQDPVDGAKTVELPDFDRAWVDVDQDGNVLRRFGIVIGK